MEAAADDFHVGCSTTVALLDVVALLAAVAKDTILCVTNACDPLLSSPTNSHHERKGTHWQTHSARKTPGLQFTNSKANASQCRKHFATNA